MRFAPSVLAAAALVLLGLPAIAQADSAYPVATTTSATTTAPTVSTATAPAANPVGRLEVARQSAGTVTVSGWSFDRNALTTAERIDIWQTAPVRKIAGHAFTTLARPDVNSYYKITGNHGYLGTFGGDPGTDTFCAYGINIGAGANTMLGCAEVVIPTSAPLGHLDVATATDQSVALAGWAYDPDLPTNADQVLLTDGSTKLSPVTTTLTRSDINSHFHITGAHGWQTTLTATPGAHTYCATAVNLGPARANVAIGCKTVTVSAPPPPATHPWMYGNVLDTSYAPVVGTTVNATTKDGTVITSTVTDAQGDYRLDVAQGDYRICLPGDADTAAPLGYLPQCFSFAGQGGPPADLYLTANQGYGSYDLLMSPLAQIQGRVTDTSGAPLAGVVVDSQGSLPGTATTAADGTYTLRRPAGGANVCFHAESATGGTSAIGYINRCWGPYGGTAVFANPGQTTTGIDIALGLAATVSGQVTDAAGHPLQNVQVHLDFVQTTTDADGAYSFTGLAAGSYSIVQVVPDASTTGGTSTTGYMSWCPGDPQGVHCTALTVTGGAVTTMNAVLTAGGAISGRVVDNSGQPIAGISVDLGGDRNGSTYTGADGSFRFDSLGAGTYSICFARTNTVTNGGDGYLNQCWQNNNKYPYTPIAVTAGNVSSGIDATLLPLGHISGRVTDATGKALAGVQITGYFDGDGVSGGVGGTTAADGTYTLPRLNPGTYHLCYLTTDATYAEACQSPDIVLSPGQSATAVDIVLPLAATISGTVTDERGYPITGVTVRNYDSYDHVITAQTAADGSYTLVGLAPGTHAVCFDASGVWQPPALGYSPQCWQDVDQDSPPTSITLAAGQKLTGIDAVIHPTAAISGRVTDSAGHPLRNVSVFSNDEHFATTDANGNYLLIQLTPGARTVCFDPYQATGGSSTTGYQQACYQDVDIHGTPTPITVTAHQTTTGIDQKLQANPVSS